MSADNDEFTDAEKAAIARGLAVAADRRAPLRIVHDPDTGCYRCHGSRIDADGLPWFCEFVFQPLPVGNPVVDDAYRPAPPWCPLRAGDVVVSAKKDST